MTAPSSCVLSAALLGACFLSAGPAHAAPSAAEEEAREALAKEIDGAVCYVRKGRAYAVTIGRWQPVELGRGEYARWGPKGERIAVYHKKRFHVVDPTTGERTKVPGVFRKPRSPAFFDFHPNGTEIVYISQGEGIFAVRITTGETRKLIDCLHPYTGELGISADGRRLACRGCRNSYRQPDTYCLWAVDVDRQLDRLYVEPACAAGVSPDGRRLMNNGDEGRQTHERMNVRDWDGRTVRILHTRSYRKGAHWDNHHWSNHDDYICGQLRAKGFRGDEVCVIRISTDTTTRVTWTGGVVYPDLFVGHSGDSYQQ